jgi:hypothetical protein
VCHGFFFDGIENPFISELRPTIAQKSEMKDFKVKKKKKRMHPRKEGRKLILSIGPLRSRRRVTQFRSVFA